MVIDGFREFPISGCRSCLGRDEFWQTDQVVAGHRQGELEAELLDTSQHGPREPADGHGAADSAWLTPTSFVIEGLAVPATRRSMRL
jgi:hypothetical protein